MSGSKGNTAHFVWRCGSCKRESSAKFDDKHPTIPYTADANGQFAPFLTIECRGLEFVGFEARVRKGGIRSDVQFTLISIFPGNLEVCRRRVWDRLPGRRS